MLLTQTKIKIFFTIESSKNIETDVSTYYSEVALQLDELDK